WLLSGARDKSGEAWSALFEESDRFKASTLAHDPEYLAIKSEMGRLLQLGPQDINPLDDWPEEWDSDTRMHALQRGYELRSRLFDAYFDLVLRRRSLSPLGVVRSSNTSGEEKA